MTTPLASAFVEARLDTSKFGSDIKKGVSSPSVASGVKSGGTTMGGQFKSSFGSALKGIAAPLIAAIGTAAVGKFLVDSIKGASDLAETGNKIGVVFKGAAGTVTSFSKDAATALGQSQQAALDGAATFGVFGKSAGLAADENAKFSTEMVTLASDMASFSNTSPEEAINAIGSALRGEAEPIRQYGVLLDDATLKAQAMKLGLISTTTDALSPANKVLAAHAEILAQTTDAQGDFARTSDGLANQQKILSAQFADTQAQIGEKLLPVVTNMFQFINEEGLPALKDFGGFLEADVIPPLKVVGGAVGETVDAFTALPGPIKDVIVALGLGALAVKGFKTAAGTSFGKTISGGFQTIHFQALLAQEAMGKAEGGVTKFGTAAKKVSAGGMSAMKSAGGGLLTMFGGGWGLALAGAGIALGILGKSFADAKADAERLHAEAIGLVDTLDASTGAITKETLAKQIEALSDSGTLADLTAMGVAAEDVTRALAGDPDALKRVQGVFEAQSNFLGNMSAEDLKPMLEFNAALDAQGVAAEALAALDPAKDAIKGVGLEAGHAKVGVAGFMGGLMDLIPPLKDQEKYVEEAKDALVGYRSVAASLISKQLGLSQAILDAKDALKENADGFNKNTEAGIANYGVVLDLAAATEGFRGDTDRGREAIEKARQSIIDYAHAQGQTIPEAEKMADKLLGVADAGNKVGEADADMHVSADTSQARADIDGFVRDANAKIHGGLRDEPVAITLSAQAAKIADQLDFIGVAAGGPIFGGRAGKDSVKALLMPGEHVWTADEVSKAGGHGVIQGLRRLAKAGELGRHGDISAFASGGPVYGARSTGLDSAVASVGEYFQNVVAAISSALSGKLSEAVTTMPTAGQLGSGGTLTPAQLVRGQGFANAQVGKPYVWGGVGPGGYDCSGFVGAVLNAARGVNPYQRVGSTGTMPWAGSGAGAGRYSIGWSTDTGGGIGHTAGNIGGLNVESYGGHGPATGSGARSPLDSMFGHLMHYDAGGVLPPGTTVAVNKSGRNERVVSGAQEDEVARALDKLAGLIGENGPLAKLAKTLQKSFDKLSRSFDKAREDLSDSKDHLRGILDAERDLSASIASGFDTTEYGEGADTSSKDMFNRARAEVNDATLFRHVLNQLKAKGANPALLRALALAGPGAIVQAQALAALSRKELNRYQHLLGAGDRAQDALGDLIGNQVYGGKIAESRKDVRELTHAMNDLREKMGKLDDKVADAVKRGLHHAQVVLDARKVGEVLSDRQDRRNRGH